jgi:predicted urease superfamily metal-dependent hydrolase
MVGMILELKNKFSRSVELYVERWNVSYMDAVLTLCEEYNVEPEAVVKHLSKPVLEKIKVEGQSLNFLPKTKTKLPF